MRIFVTGASGWIGSALVPELLAAGHQVAGLARSDASAAALGAAGVDVVRGTLDDLDVLRNAADGADGVIHLAFKHDTAFAGDYPGAVAADRRAVDAFGDALAHSDRPFVLASGLAGLAPEPVLTEATPTASGDSPLAHRSATARAALELADRGVRASVLRLATTCHGDGDPGLLAALIATARATGVSGYLGDGSQRWPAAHRVDVARLFHLAVERAPAGAVLHGVAEEGVPIRAIAETIGRHLDLPVTSVAPVASDAATEHFSWLSPFLGLDSPASSALTRELLGWQPTHPGLLEQLDQGHYFRAPADAA
ncbi:SDR family oxidoreductase [Streptomyces sp. AC563]|uniref:SDR family oxidoreductase n=1 Tax=Streptomyces buecherae TaxID=2763006 RepID=UPI00164CE37D|nr:SDR family oxidoreductase [Streptomyces buecherae]MBC3987505.1 SDR family oxidoreductase [Streptomyces buecherae]